LKAEKIEAAMTESVRVIRGKLFIISAPSGAGKTTLVQALLKKMGQEYCLARVITYTTKKPREGEVNGCDYHFIGEQEFHAKKEEGFFLEWSCAYIDFYGSPRSILAEMECGKSFILIIDRHGAKMLAAQVKDAVLIWVDVSDLRTLKARLVSRGTETESQLEKRLCQAMKEIKQERQEAFYRYHVKNDNFDDSIANLEEIVRCELCNEKSL
jgi:guanylate kinase